MFQIIRRVILGTLVIAAATVVGIEGESVVLASCVSSNTTGNSGYGANVGCQDANPPDAPPARSTYCDNIQASEVKDPETAKLVWTPDSESQDLFRYSDGRQDSYNLTQYTTENDDYTVEGTDNSVVSKVIVNTTAAPAYERRYIFCRLGDQIIRRTDVWVPLMQPEGMLERYNLFAEVVAALPDPTVTFNADADHDWLWVQVDHRASIVKPDPITKSKTDSDPSGWASPSSVTAWITATPVAFSIWVQSEAGEQYLGSCNLAAVTNGTGCRVKFTHSSSIAKDGVFYGAATVEWVLDSNAGSFAGVGPITTHSGFSVKVAEAMAVTNSGR